MRWPNFTASSAAIVAVAVSRCAGAGNSTRRGDQRHPHPGWIAAKWQPCSIAILIPRGATNRIIREIWEDVERIPDAELWRTHERRRERLVSLARTKLRAQLIARGAPQTEIEAASEVLNPDALTIGFARRFATYKRATLLFRDKERLATVDQQPRIGRCSSFSRARRTRTIILARN